MSTKQNVSADRFIGRCPSCGETTDMVKQRKLPRHPVTEWRGECSCHRIYVKTEPREGFEVDASETELLASIGLMMYEMWLAEAGIGGDTEMDRAMRKLSALRDNRQDAIDHTDAVMARDKLVEQFPRPLHIGISEWDEMLRQKSAAIGNQLLGKP